MKVNSFLIRCFAILALFHFCSCGKYVLPTLEGESKLPTSIDHGSGSGGTTPTYTPDDENFIALRDVEKKLSSLAQTHNITAAKPNPEYGTATSNRKIIIFNHIDAISKELTRLKNQPKPKPIVQPTNSNQTEKLQNEVDNLNSIIDAKDQEVRGLNEKIITLNEQIAQLSKRPIVVQPPQPPLPEPERLHTCKVQLKKSKVFVKDIKVKGYVITFNFKFGLNDIKTQHPRNSFTIENNKKLTFLTITNPKLFWSNSDELIVWAKKKYHACIDRDIRKKN